MHVLAHACFLMGVLSASFATSVIDPTVGAPGKAVFWSFFSISEPKHITKSVDYTRVKEMMHEILPDYNAIAVFVPDKGESFLHNEAVTQSIKSSPSQTFFYTIYSSDSSMEDSFYSATTENKMNFREFVGLMGDRAPTSIAPVYQVSLKGSTLTEKDITSLQAISINNKMLFVTFDEPTTRPPSVAGGYKITRGSPKRALADENNDDDVHDTGDSSSLYYMPEGTEWTIYYANSYIYMTPDLFTGIMTFLFMFFTVLVGFCCLGEIQGITYFYDKLPVVGKEA